MPILQAEDVDEVIHTWANASAGDNTEHIHFFQQNDVAKVFHNAKTSQQSR